MPQLIQVNAAGREISEPITLDRRRRRLPQVIAAHVDRSRPFMIAVQRESELSKPIGESWVVRGWKVPPVRDEKGEIVTPGRVNPWPRKYLARDCTVVVVYLPHGGGGGAGGGGRSKSPLAIVAGIAGLALMAFAGPLAAGLTPLLGLAGASFAGISGAAFVQAGAVLGSTVLVPLRSSQNDRAEYLRHTGCDPHCDGRRELAAGWPNCARGPEGRDPGAPAGGDRPSWPFPAHPVARRQRVRQLHGIRWARRRRARSVPRGA